jgi:hypothetical protein
MTFPFDEAIQLAKIARPLLPRGHSVLYHGSRYPAAILRDNVLWCANVGTFAVSFTRLLHVAIYWAQVPRDDEEKVGAVFVLDRDRLARAYKLEPFRDPFWDNCPARSTRKASEAEEQVYGRDVVGLNEFLVDVVLVLPDGTLRSKRASRRPPHEHRCRKPQVKEPFNVGGKLTNGSDVPSLLWGQERHPPR